MAEKKAEMKTEKKRIQAFDVSDEDDDICRLDVIDDIGVVPDLMSLDKNVAPGLGAGYWGVGEKARVLNLLDGWHLEGFLAADDFVMSEQFAGESDESSAFRGLPTKNDPAIAWVACDLDIESHSKYARKRVGRVYTWAKCGLLQQGGTVKGKACPLPAGHGTTHVGAGRCVTHGGAKRVGRAMGAWLMGHAYAQQLNVSPWEALLMAVRIAAGKVAYIEQVLGTARDDLELEGRRPVEIGEGVGGVAGEGEGVGEKSWLGGAGVLLVHPDTGEPLGAGRYRDLSWWVEKGEIWHDRLVKSSKTAIDAGIARWQIEKVEADAHTIAQVLNGILEELGDDITEDQALRLRARMRKELLALEEQVSTAPALSL